MVSSRGPAGEPLSTSHGQRPESDPPLVSEPIGLQVDRTRSRSKPDRDGGFGEFRLLDRRDKPLGEVERVSGRDPELGQDARSR